MPILEILAPYDHEIQKMAKLLSKSETEAHDLKMDFYVHISNKDAEGKIKLKGTTFEEWKNYIFISLRNFSSDRNKKDYNRIKNYTMLPIVDDVVSLEGEDDTDEIYEQEEMNKIITHFLTHGYKEQLPDEKFKTLNYKIQLLKLHAVEGISIRKIAELTTIDVGQVQRAIASIKKIIRTRHQDDYDMYIKRISESKYGK